jgi:hypothetical protein
MNSVIPSLITALAVCGAPPAAASTDCGAVTLRTKAMADRTSADPIELLRLVDREVSAHPDCACEIVKAAIVGTDSEDAIVGYIVETAVRAAPEHMRLIGQCAMATAPDSLARIQEVLARLDPSAGEKAKSAKSAKSQKGIEVKPEATPPDPLDFPIITVPPIPPVINPPPSTISDRTSG